MLIRLAEYAKKLGKHPDYVRQRAAAGRFKTATKIGKKIFPPLLKTQKRLRLPLRGIGAYFFCIAHKKEIPSIREYLFMSEMRLVFELSPYGLLTFGVITQIKFARLHLSKAWCSGFGVSLV